MMRGESHAFFVAGKGRQPMRYVLQLLSDILRAPRPVPRKKTEVEFYSLKRRLRRHYYETPIY